MRRLFSVFAILVLASSALAVEPQFWRTGSAEEFLAGEIEGMAVTSRGELMAAPTATKMASFTEPFVLSQTSAPNGDRFFGTGNAGKVYRLRGGALKELFIAPEPEIYAVQFVGGHLYVGSSPNGKVYKVDPESGTSSVFFDPGQAYIWDIQQLKGSLLAVATGVEGKLFRVDAAGKGTVLFDATDTHLRSLAVMRDGTILAGASAKGRIYRIAPGGAAVTLFESPLNEITAIHVDANGTGWAAAATNILPSAAPKTQKPAQQQPGSGGASDARKESEPSQGAVEVSYSFEDSSSTSAAVSGAGEVYRIDADGYVSTVRKFDREMVYTIAEGSTPGSVLLGTGPNGRVYELRGHDLSLMAAVPEKQVISIASGSEPLLTTTNAGAVYRLAGRGSGKIRSAVKDAERFSRFGSYRVEGRNLSDGVVAVSFRSGNSRTPDATWSDWSTPATALEGSVNAPPARYLQWSLETKRPAADAAIDAVTVAILNRNVAPEIEAFVVQDPSVVFISSSYPNSPGVVEATNPDEYGIFTSLDSPRDRTSSDPGKRAYRRGFRTVSWRARDENGDTLEYSLSFRRKGESKWLRLRDRIEDSQLNFDTTQLPDGVYELRLSVSDEKSNPSDPLKDERADVEMLVDNTPPAIEVTRTGEGVTIRISDALSPVGRVEYSADAQKWIRMQPTDGLADSRSETFRLDSGDVAGRFVVIRAVDGFSNVATRSVSADE